MADFLEAVMDTRPMRYCQALLVAMVRVQHITFYFVCVCGGVLVSLGGVKNCLA
jgi:hypothetical protein